MNVKLVYKLHGTKYLLNALFMMIQTYTGIVNIFYELPKRFCS